MMRWGLTFAANTGAMQQNLSGALEEISQGKGSGSSPQGLVGSSELLQHSLNLCVHSHVLSFCGKRAPSEEHTADVVEEQVDMPHKFLAAPNPPGNTTASNSAVFSDERVAMFPRAMRADSTRTFLHTPAEE